MRRKNKKRRRDYRKKLREFRKNKSVWPRFKN
jgi:hypothetical protein